VEEQKSNEKNEPSEVNPDVKVEESSDDGRGEGRKRSRRTDRNLNQALSESARPNLPIWHDAQIPASLELEVSVRTLLEAGVHFGHQTSRWNPIMASNIYTVRNGIHIINLPKTMQAWMTAKNAIVDLVAQGGSVLFVGTKKQAQEAIVEEAKRCASFYVSHRWLGGMLTNFSTIRKSVDRMKKVEEILVQEEEALKVGRGMKFTKKERLMMARELEKLNLSLAGIRDMTSLPQLIFVIDIRREDIAVKEAKRLDIPVFALVDTNCDPNVVNYPIPSNDDGTRAIRLFAKAVAEAVNEGRRKYFETKKHSPADGGKSSSKRGGGSSSASKYKGDTSAQAAAV
jgi:small subunit ribosomal protein S2